MLDLLRNIPRCPMFYLIEPIRQLKALLQTLAHSATEKKRKPCKP